MALAWKKRSECSYFTGIFATPFPIPGHSDAGCSDSGRGRAGRVGARRGGAGSRGKRAFEKIIYID